MAKRHAKQQFRSYHHDFPYIPAVEVKRHVLNASRLDADIIFNELAHEAAMNGINGNYCGEQGVCFMQPTDNPHGYYSLLKLVAKNTCMFRSDIVDSWKCKPYTTLTRLVDGKLLHAEVAKNPKTKRPCNLFSLSELGKLYLDVASKYLVKRQTKKNLFS